MKIDRLTEHDLPAALRLSTQAGWNQLEADWRRLITLWPQGCFAGRKDGKLIATATLATYGQSLGWIGMVLVDERHRGHGFGGALLAAALLAAKELGVQTVGLDATDLGWPVYLRRGFRDVGGIDRWVCSPARCAGPASRGTIISAAGALAGGSSRVPDKTAGEGAGGTETFSNSVISPTTESVRGLDATQFVHDDLNSFDYRTTGIDHGKLLNHLRHEPGVHCGVVHNDGGIRAFALSRPGRIASHIGPVVAETEMDAINAIQQILYMPGNEVSQSTFIDVPCGQLASWLMSNGFTILRKLTRMCLGTGSLSLSNPKIFAACSFELG